MNTLTRTKLQVMMFLEFFIWGAWFVPMYQFVSHLGFSDGQIAMAYSTTAIAAIISPLFMGILADRLFPAQIILGLLHIAGGALLIATSYLGDFNAFFTVLLIYTLTYMPTLALTNSIAFEQMKNPESEFPPIRVLGTIGWIVAGLIIGFGPSLLGGAAIEATGWPMRIAGGVAIVMGLFCFALPHTPPKDKGKAFDFSAAIGARAFGMMKDFNFATFVIGSFLICIPLAFYYQSANGFLADVGMPNVTGYMTLGQGSEILFMLVMPLAFARFGVKYMLLIGMLAWVLRYAMFAFGSWDSTGMAALLFGGIVLHGVCYDFFFVTGFIYVDRKAPADLRASAQGFITLVTQGVGMLVGNYINGQINGFYTTEKIVEDVSVAEKNWQMIWLVPAIMAAVVMILFAIMFNDRTADEPDEAQPQDAIEPA